MNLVELIVKDIISEHYDYLSQCERNITENQKHIAILKSRSYELQSQTELAEKYFNHQIAERERLLNSTLQVLDKAMNTGDSEFAEIAVRILEVLHSKSPFSF